MNRCLDRCRTAGHLTVTPRAISAFAWSLAGRPAALAAWLVLAATPALSTAHVSAQDAPQKATHLRFDRVLLLEDSSYTSANVSFGDLNGDGHLDVVLVKGRHWPLQNLVRIGDGKGGFAPARPMGNAADRSYSGLLVDVDGDGDLDVVVSNDRPDRKLVYLNDGSGRFEAGSTLGEPEWSTRYITAADLNRDGLQDIVFANRYGPRNGPEYICFGVGGGHFEDPCTEFATTSATTITAADFDGDGDLDLAVPHRDGGQSYVYLNDGSGHFDNKMAFGSPDAAIRTAATADLDGDGVLDLAVIDERTGPATYHGRGGGAFDPPVSLGDVDATPYAIKVADLDQDGRPDVIVGYRGAHPIVFFNEGGGTFTPVPFGDDQGEAYGFAVGDVNEDGFLDIGMARSDAPNVIYFGGPARGG